MTDFEKLTRLIENNFESTNQNIQTVQTSIQNEIAGMRENIDTHNTRIEKIENQMQNCVNQNHLDQIHHQIELLKQERLRNNLRLTGLPSFALDDPVQTIMRIDDLIHLDLIPSDFTAYADKNKSSLIVSFSSYAHKRLLVESLYKRKSLLVEEIFPDTKSN